MKHIGRLVAAAFVLTCVVAPSITWADNTTCPNATLLVADGTAKLDTFPAAGQKWYRFVAKADRSYAIMVDNLAPADVNSTVSLSSPTATCGGAAVPVTERSGIEPVAYDGSAGSGRWALKVTANTEVFVPLFGASGGAFSVRIQETTLISPLFTTFSGFETFYRFVNTTNFSVSVTLKLISDAGTVVGNTTLSIPANSTAATRNTGPTDLNVADNTAGQAIITYDGSPGAIQVDGFSGNFSVNPPIVLPIKIVNARQDR